jgi:hydrogenase maturation protease
MIKPLLFLAYGNPSRGDDALGPLLLDFVLQNLPQQSIEFITDFQLQIEHILDLQNRQLILFADASANCSNAYQLSELRAIKDVSYSSHALSPWALYWVYQSVSHASAPPGFLLSIQGSDFELGAGLSPAAKSNLSAASRFVLQLLNNPNLEYWRQLSCPTGKELY